MFAYVTPLVPHTGLNGQNRQNQQNLGGGISSGAGIVEFCALLVAKHKMIAKATMARDFMMLDGSED